MRLTINKFDILLFAFSLYCFICFQITEFKFYNVKLNELITLIFVPVLLFTVKRLNKYLIYFFLFFCFILLVTFIKNINQDFYLDTDKLSFLRWPYLISLARFFEFLACFIFSVIVYKVINYLVEKGFTIEKVVNNVLFVNGFFSIIYIVLFFIYYTGISAYQYSSIVYDTAPYLATPILRLKGFFVEGGPFGLFYAFLFCLSDIINKKKYFLKTIFVIIILLAQSKAGIIAVTGWVFFKLYWKFRQRTITKYIIFLILVPCFLFISIKIANNYIVTYKQTKALISHRSTDTNFTMGRTAAFYIAPKMIQHNPITGIGLGNYSLVRNNPLYLGILPVVDEWDLPGLGGFITLLIENGMLGLSLFLLIVYLFYKRYSKVSLIAGTCIILFLLICCLGVQLYFLYIWFLIGLVVAIAENNTEYK